MNVVVAVAADRRPARLGTGLKPGHPNAFHTLPCAIRCLEPLSMPSRSEMDRPATVAAALFGVVLIAVSVPFLGSVGGGEGTEYLITWTSVDEASEEGQLSGNSASGSVEVNVEDVVPSVAVIEFDPCNDGFTPPVQSAAQISWVLRWETHEESGTASCADSGPFEVEIEPEPDVGSAEGGSASAARQAAYAAAGMNETVTFSLEVTVTRPAGQVPPLPLPVGQPTFTATARLTIEAWTASATEPGQEAPR